jgi:hypothetical protein
VSSTTFPSRSRLAEPTTRTLENGAAGTLSAARSFEIVGSYREAGVRWTIDLQLARPGTEHVVMGAGEARLEAIVVGKDAYFRGQRFLAEHLGSDPRSQALARAPAVPGGKDLQDRCRSCRISPMAPPSGRRSSGRR